MITLAELKRKSREEKWVAKHPGRHYTDDKFIMVNGKVKREYDLLKWGDWFGKNNRRVRQTDVGRFFVSTVFLGLDYSFTYRSRRKPVLFETMVFTRLSAAQAKEKLEEWKKSVRMMAKTSSAMKKMLREKTVPSVYTKGSLQEAEGFNMERYATLAEAKRGHQRMVALVKRSLTK